MIYVKALAAWFFLVILAILNGTLRVKLLVPLMGEQWAQPLSGVMLSLIILLLAWLVLPWLGPRSNPSLWLIGFLWLGLTLIFEFVFGRLVAGKSWQELLAAYDITTGNLWLLVLVTTAVAPWLATKLRGCLSASEFADM
jgi:hypothetical protein